MALLMGRARLAASSACPLLPQQHKLLLSFPIVSSCGASTSQRSLDLDGMNRCYAHGFSSARRRSAAPQASSASAFDPPADDGLPTGEDFEYKPFARLKERDPFRLLGVPKDASAEEVTGARNYLYEQYRWHEPSRDAIELAFDSIIQSTLKSRLSGGFKPTKTGRRTDMVGGPARKNLLQQVSELFDPTITLKTWINEGIVFAALAAWAIFSGDQSFPLVGAFGYSVYKFNLKRTKNDPEANAVVGAIITTMLSLVLACAVAAIVSQPLAGLVSNMQQISGFLVIVIVGALNVTLK